jgi:hypothetical protein
MLKPTCLHALILFFVVAVLIPGVVETSDYYFDITLQWDANTEPNLAGYKVYYGTASRVYTVSKNARKVTQFTLKGLPLGPDYYFAVTAYDTQQKESDFSKELIYISCPKTISPSTADFPAGGGQGTVQVTAGNNCPWTVSKSASWVTITGGQSGAGSGIVTYSLSANDAISTRIAVLTIAGNVFVAAQKGGSPTPKTITASASSGGTISPAGSVKVNSGESQTFKIVRNTGYSISQVLVDGKSVGPVRSYTFSNITADHTITAIFGGP